MHIKQVVISGFRSFRHQSEIEPFSPKHNVIIGRNGSGKSNFFAAIQFVLLSQKFMHLRQEERQQLLHEGAGANVMSAFVEVIFDNSDGRMTVEGDEVVLRRTIGVKKDEFFLNRKRVTKQEVSSLLESAGFSRSNPYYIVQQGKVNILTLMRDDQRLDLLKEVAGTKVYEERREESLQIMNETNNKRDKIQEVVSYIEERLGELEEEKEELKAYQQLDKDRRALEYTLYDKELRQARDELTRAEESRKREIERADDLHRQLGETRDALAALESQLTVLSEELGRKEEDRGALEREREALLAERERDANEERALRKKVEQDAKRQGELKERLKSLEKKVAEVREKLAGEVEPAYQEAQRVVQGLTKELQEKEAQKAELFDKQGRRSAFRSVDERDRHLKKQMEEIQGSVGERESLMAKNEAERDRFRREIEREKGVMEKRGADIAAKEKALASLNEERSRMLLARSEKQDERKKKQEAVAQLEEERAKLGDKLRKAEQGLKFSIPRHIAKGLESVERLAKEGDVCGYYGPVYELIRLNDPKFTQAVEVAAGNSLFNVVVDTDETAAKLLKKLEDRNLGRVCFMPLNRLRVKHVNYPDSPDVVALLKAALTYPKEVEKAMQQIFGQKLLARDLEVAARFSESANLDAITLEGDEANRKGSMQGGYHDEKSSRIAQVTAIREAKAELEPLEGRLAAEERALLDVDAEMTRMLAELQKKERDSGGLSSDVETLSGQIKAAKHRIEMLKANIEKVEAALPGDRAEVEAMRKLLASYQAELGTPLEGSLSAADSRTLQEIEARIPQINKELKSASDKLGKKKSERARLKYRLEENLTKAMEKVLEELTPENGGSGHVVKVEMVERKRLLELKHGELAQMARKVEAVQEKLRAMDQATERQRNEERQLKLQSDDRRAEEARVKAQVAEVGKAQEKLINKRSMALQKRDSSLRKIQELGSLPAAELELYKNYSIKQLYKHLHECNDKLKKYSHVNKKALDQYVNFSEQREELLQRKKELDDGAAAIQKLIENLDLQKDEAIHRTFRGVSKHFEDVFKELVPNGYGRMVLRTTADKTRELTDEHAEQETQTASLGQGSEPLRVSDYKGIQIQVSFTGQGDRYLMQQLSGGQKALVALALIFSIQRCDPAPFYLFDEVDQALDSTYRAAVAALIQRQANSEENPAQFITTTFRPELVRVADRCYGISLQNKVSSIDILPKQTALEFVRELQEEDEKLAGVSSVKRRGSGGKKAGGGKGKGKQMEEEEEEEEEEQREAEPMEDGGTEEDEEEEQQQEEEEEKGRRQSSGRKRKGRGGE